MSCLELSLTVPEQQVAAVEELLLGLGALSLSLAETGGQKIYGEPGSAANQLWSQTKISAIFALNTEPLEILLALTQHLEPEITATASWHKLEEQDWQRKWQQHLRPMHFGANLWVCPTGHQPPDPAALNITLDPGQAFGTGTHASTRLCLQTLSAMPIAGKDCIDYGCGSGILAIAMLKLGANNCVAVDLDPTALTVCQENASRNTIKQDQLQILQAPADNLPPADLLVANILMEPLLELLPLFAKLVKTDGELILAGILNEQQDRIIKAYQQYFQDFQCQIDGEWCSLRAIRNTIK